ncbi:MAG TPA: homoserine O-acetyltransferase [Planctomycetota bacterium]|nr:homoserine O-acetyltransferase [Planctomycetota bacterium]
MAAPQFLELKREFPLVLGGSLAEVVVRYEEFGRPRGDGRDTLVVFPALSAHSHLRSTAEDPVEGWWEEMVGPGRTFDTERWHIVCASLLGSCYGTTGGLSTDPRTGRPYGRDFPQITPSDQVHVHAALLDALGLKRVHAAIGASLGGMQVLQFAAEYPDRLDRFIAISMTAKTTPHTVALRRIGRLAILNDPAYMDGRYEPGRGPVSGIKLAREIGTILYRSRDEFNQRFSWDPIGPLGPAAKAFEVEQYLAAQADRFATRFDPNCYLTLSRCMDLMDLGQGCRSLKEGVLRIKARGLIVGVDRDALIPIDEQEAVFKTLRAAERDVRFERLSSVFGHDAFLKEFEWQKHHFAPFLEA